MAEFEAALDQVRESLFAKDKPATLCHFTNRAGFIGIMRDNQIWATPAAGHSTDRDELMHADKLISATALHMCRRVAQHERVMLLRLATKWQRESLVRRASGNLFIACYTPFSDNVSAWTDFADRGQGFSIEFELLNESLVTPGLDVGLFALGYSTGEARQRLERVFTRYFEVARGLRVTADNEAFLGKLDQALWVAAGTTAVGLKGRKFRDQREWRLAALRIGDEYPVHDSPRRHVKIPLRANNGDLPTIRAIHVGAHAPADAESLAEQLTADYPIDKRPQIIRSTVQIESPYATR